MSNAFTCAKPVFIRQDALPYTEERPFETDLCEACERVTGIDSIFACQKAFGSYRIHAINEQKRALLITNGIEYKGIRIFPQPTNPNRTWTYNGVVVQTEDLIISAAPLSLSEQSILESVQKAGYTVLSDIKLDCHRNKEKKVTRFKNGNRSMKIVRPTAVLPSTILIQDQFRVFVNYWGREQVELQVRENEKKLNYTKKAVTSTENTLTPQRLVNTAHSPITHTATESVPAADTREVRTQEQNLTRGKVSPFLSGIERQLLDKVDANPNPPGKNTRVGPKLRNPKSLASLARETISLQDSSSHAKETTLAERHSRSKSQSKRPKKNRR